MTIPQGRRGIISAGRIYCDLVFTGLQDMPRLGAEVFAEAMVPVLGGGAFIAATHIAAHRRPSALLSRFGTDPLSMMLESQLVASGVDLRFVERQADAGPQVTVVMAHASDRAFLSRRAGQALPRDYGAALDWDQACHLHIAEFATLAECADLVQRAKAGGLTVSLDPSWDETLIRQPALLAACAGVDVFLPNAEEALAITGTGTVEDAIAILEDAFPVVAIKLGPDGAMLSVGGWRFARPAPSVTVVDTTGAGDAFNAGLLDAWLDGLRAELCLDAAIMAGSLSVQAVGGTAALQSGAA
ncbi:carbohydrate kinase family protein [Devosia sp. Root635]|uniref:carbohydrate kinase family protein n=1 Tax=Devosia sp. Root635 TaxID=1736575 RepID=UPI000701DB47|nr:PfkB family carbohydrate kinase [Devosia sp. Root635]KRA43110.1 ribokinase [Devosia sp. Root635]